MNKKSKHPRILDEKSFRASYLNPPKQYLKGESPSENRRSRLSKENMYMGWGGGGIKEVVQRYNNNVRGGKI